MPKKFVLHNWSQFEKVLSKATRIIVDYDINNTNHKIAIKAGNNR
jgi:hypothetical protein